MQITVASVRVLRTIYALRRNDLRVSASSVAAALAEPVEVVEGCLAELAGQGLVQDAAPLRLTFSGLAVAAATSPRALAQPRPETAVVATIPLGPRLSPCPVVKAQPRRAAKRRRSQPAPQKHMPRKQMLLAQSELFVHV